MSQIIHPALSLVMVARTRPAEPILIGDMERGVRRLNVIAEGTFEMFDVEGSTFKSRALKGEVVDWRDWQIVYGDNLSTLDARITLRTEDGHYIYKQAQGRRWGPPEVIARLRRGEPVSRLDYYGCAAATVETAAPGLEWMNHHQFIGNSRNEDGWAVVSLYVVHYPQVE